jgi:hypothetical protein
MRLYHRTHRPDGVLAEGFRDGEEHMSDGGEFRRGVWFSDRPDPDAAGDPSMTLLYLEVPDEVALRYRLDAPPDATYHEYCLPEDVANGFGRPQLRAEPSLAETFGELPSGAGAIALLSSDEFTEAAEPFDAALLNACGSRVAIVLAADAHAAPHSAALANAHYRALGATPAITGVLRRDDARADAVPDCDVLFLAGGNPSDLLHALGGTPFWDESLRRWRSGLSLAGSSAGAMALCEHCLTPEPGADKPTRWSAGLGPVRTAALAVHASSRPDAWLHHIAATAPVPVVALDDATGVLLRAADEPIVAGPGRVRVVRAGGG